jgi:type IV secretion system protein VirB9
MVKTISFLFLVLIAVSASGQPANSSSKFGEDLLGGSNPVLTDQEKAGVAITDGWKDKSLQTLVGQPGVSSSVQFRFAESYPTIVCAVLQVTDIELQPGEAVTHINLGDSTRWTVESAVSGSGAGQIDHLIVKPRDIGLSTSLIVTTDRRTYHLLLVSDEKEFMHDVTFLYQAAVFVADTSPAPAPSPSPPAKSPPSHHKQSDGKKVAADTPADDADEDYIVKGKPEWKPVGIYSKNGKTYIEMPSSVRHKEAPVLFEEKKAGLFGHSKDICNYRVHGKWYVVDKVLDRATLVSGVGSGQERVTIRRAKTKGGLANGQ